MNLKQDRMVYQSIPAGQCDSKFAGRYTLDVWGGWAKTGRTYVDFTRYIVLYSEDREATSRPGLYHLCHGYIIYARAIYSEEQNYLETTTGTPSTSFGKESVWSAAASSQTWMRKETSTAV